MSEEKFIVSTDTICATFVNEIVGTCPLHGGQRQYVAVSLGIPLDGKYCQTCFAHLIARECERLK